MENYRTDEEQVEALKRWWETNGKVVILFGILFVAGTVGGNVWMDYKHSTASKASTEYDLMMQEMQTGKAEAAMQRGATLMEQHKDSTYAALAALAVAKLEVEKGDYSAAGSRLKWVLDNVTETNVQHVARLRLIRVMVEESKLDEALALANIAEAGKFKPEYDVLKGDIYVAKGQSDLARGAYQAALSGEGLSPQTTSELRLKLDDLGGGASS
ncbi:MAG: tetratricopeptide repeat protein [Gammaproteobacteria bacterium]|nr:tetratricopeptide repeat protein [Gammaproteobacteria bacterium]